MNRLKDNPNHGRIYRNHAWKISLIAVTAFIAVTFSGCGIAGVGAGVVQIEIINTENCSAVSITQADGTHWATIPAFGAATVEVPEHLVFPGSEFTLVAKSINLSEIPCGCDNWGTDYETFEFDDNGHYDDNDFDFHDDDDYVEEQWELDLDPPDYVDDEDGLNCDHN